MEECQLHVCQQTDQTCRRTDGRGYSYGKIIRIVFRAFCTVLFMIVNDVLVLYTV